ncbi:MAG TPA: bifunctional oligoribonuclease/PAP phosphatase NrnA [Clostridiaceae bacterium]
MNIDEILDIIFKSSRIAITFHVSPDGDSIGSALALTRGLKKLGKDVYIICNEKAPVTFSYLNGVDEIDGNSNYVDRDTQCLIVLDCGDLTRVSAELNLKNRRYSIVNIDHHLSNSAFGDFNYVDSKASSVGEIIYLILKKLNIALDRQMGEDLYTSLICDTGGFKYTNTTPQTLIIASELIKLKINFNNIYKIIYENKKFERIKLYGKVIDKMYLAQDKKICIMQLNREMAVDLGIEFGDTSDVIAIGMDIDTIEVGMLFKETEDGIKISLRSKSIVDVSKIAQKFGGGGHIRASGLTLNLPLEEAIKVLEDAVKEQL